ncbi:polysaccharide deacetylase [Streptomyces sp. TLI_235]|nr:polysaccharide deacetylase family protein [Streptomyces sp. TLI_235]PBC76120.1 polysaccharide deacetylase [Streptomyces sp. TLI_235]
MPDVHAAGGGITGTAPADIRRNRIDTVLRHSPLQPVFRALAAGRLAVLAYHGIDDRRSFAAQMARLARTARPVSLARVERALREGRPLPPRSVLVTFDDGDRSLLTHGLPVLARHDIPAAAYVIAGLIGGDRPFWWSEAAFLVGHGGTADGLPPGTAPDAAVRLLKRLPDGERRRRLDGLRSTAAAPAPRQPQLSPEDLRTLRDAGVAIGNHTVDHPCLDTCTPRSPRNRSSGRTTCWPDGSARSRPPSPTRTAIPTRTPNAPWPTSVPDGLPLRPPARPAAAPAAVRDQSPSGERLHNPAQVRHHPLGAAPCGAPPARRQLTGAAATDLLGAGPDHRAGGDTRMTAPTPGDRPEIHRTPSALDGATGYGWRRLVAADPHGSWFAAPEWVLSWWETLGAAGPSNGPAEVAVWRGPGGAGSRPSSRCCTPGSGCTRGCRSPPAA